MATGADYLASWNIRIAVLGMGLLFGLLISQGGLVVAVGILGLPIIIWLISQSFLTPRFALFLTLVMSFLSAGLARYVKIPWGLTLDALLVVAWVGVFFQNFRKKEWKALNNDLCWITLLWYGFILLELANPQAISVVAWFYAMRGVGFYMLLTITLVFLLYRHHTHLDKFLINIAVLSLLGTLWGFKQQLIGTDWAEDYWLWVEDHQDEHVLFGVLRVFSFYSDAGQFGASQAMMSLMFGIMAVGPGKLKYRLACGIVAFLTFLGFAISGTRGALAVPAFGGLLFLILTKNFKILTAGLAAGATIFIILKYTFLFQGVEQVRRMRTALDPNNPSLLVRLENQKTFRRYLADKPVGGGIGTAGFWGYRFSPDTLLANTATDSWYVKIWAETGIIGLCLHIMYLGYVLGKGGYIVWHLKDPVLKYKIMAIYSGMGGVIIASYGNQVFGQMPTGMVMNLIIPFVFLAPHFDQQLQQENIKPAELCS
ncbi:MAG: O-antigen ligase family protein [Bacteroidota bacterium]